MATAIDAHLVGLSNNDGLSRRFLILRIDANELYSLIRRAIRRPQIHNHDPVLIVSLGDQ